MLGFFFVFSLRNFSIAAKQPSHRELSCDCLPSKYGDENLMMQKLVSMVTEDTLAFIKAKEDFKKTIDFPGILYRYVSYN